MIKTCAASVVLTAALLFGAVPAYAEQDCFGCSVIDAGGFSASLVGRVVYVRGMRGVVIQINSDTSTVLVRLDDGREGWISAAEVYSELSEQERSSSEAGAAVVTMGLLGLFTMTGRADTPDHAAPDQGEGAEEHAAPQHDEGAEEHAAPQHDEGAEEKSSSDHGKNNNGQAESPPQDTSVDDIICAMSGTCGQQSHEDHHDPSDEKSFTLKKPAPKAGSAPKAKTSKYHAARPITDLPASVDSEPTADEADLEALKHLLSFNEDSVLDTYGARGVRLVARHPATLTYQIAPQTAKTMGTINGHVSESLQSTLEAGKEPIDVQFQCSVCAWEDNIYGMQRLVYDRHKHISQPIIFPFTPLTRHSSEGAEIPGLPSGITLVFWKNGVRYRLLHVCVDLNDAPSQCQERDSLFDEQASIRTPFDLPLNDDASTNAPKAANAASESQLPEWATVGLENNSSLQPDVTVRLGLDAFTHSPKVALDVISPTLVQALLARLDQSGHKTLSKALRSRVSKGQLRLEPVSTGWTEASLIGLTASDAYSRLTCLTTASDEALGYQNAVEGQSGCIGSAYARPFVYMAQHARHDDKDLECRADWGQVVEEHEAFGACTRYDVTSLSSADRATFEGYSHAARNGIFGIGEDLYSTLFAEPNLETIVDALAAIASARFGSEKAKPIRIRFISAADQHLPFQLLHKPGAEDDEIFGLIFDIASDKNSGVAFPPADFDNHWRVPLQQVNFFLPIFGLYTGGTDCEEVKASSFADPVASIACDHYHTIESSVINLNINVDNDFRKRLADQHPDMTTPSVTAPAFISQLKERGGNSSLIWYFGHAKTLFKRPDPSGTSTTSETAGYISDIDRSTPRLVFSQGDAEVDMMDKYHSVSARDIFGLSDAQGRRAGFFRQAPLVVLAACETGASLAGANGAISFTTAFLNKGARGVIATESEVDGNTASLVGEKFFRYFVQLDEADGASLALLRARRDVYYGQHGNLAPLLFYYAGAHGAYPEN